MVEKFAEDMIQYNLDHMQVSVFCQTVVFSIATSMLCILCITAVLYVLLVGAVALKVCIPSSTLTAVKTCPKAVSKEKSNPHRKDAAEDSALEKRKEKTEEKDIVGVGESEKTDGMTSIPDTKNVWECSSMEKNIIDRLANSDGVAGAGVKAFIAVDKEAFDVSVKKNHIAQIYKEIHSDAHNRALMNESYSRSACRIPEGRNIKYELQMKEINGLALEIDCYLKKIKYAESMLKKHEAEMAAAEKNKHDSKQCYMVYLLAVIDFGRTYLIGMKAFLEYLSLIDTKTNLLYKVRQAEAEYARAAEEEFEALVIEVTKSTAAMGYTASNLNLQNYVYIWESNAISRLVAKTNEYIRLCISKEEQKEYREIMFNLSTLCNNVKNSVLKTPKPCYARWAL